MTCIVIFLGKYFIQKKTLVKRLIKIIFSKFSTIKLVSLAISFVISLSGHNHDSIQEADFLFKWQHINIYAFFCSDNMINSNTKLYIYEQISS